MFVYNINRNERGEYCQFERYRDTQALLDHMANTKELLEEWYSLTEIKELIVLGEPTTSLDVLEGLPHRKFTFFRGLDR